MSRRRRLLLEGAGLPSDFYSQLPYIGFNGDSWIDTGYIPSCTDTVTCGGVISAGNYNTLFGCTSIGGNNFGLMTVLKTMASRYGGTTKRGTWQPGVTYHDYVFKNGNVYADGSLIIENTADAFILDRNLYIGAFNGTGSAANPLTGEIYYLDAYNSMGELQRRYLPCARKSDGAVGLFETVYQQFIPKTAR